MHFFYPRDNDNFISENISDNNQIQYLQSLEDLKYNLIRFISLIYMRKLQINYLVVEQIAMYMIHFMLKDNFH